MKMKCGSYETRENVERNNHQHEKNNQRENEEMWHQRNEISASWKSEKEKKNNNRISEENGIEITTSTIEEEINEMFASITAKTGTKIEISKIISAEMAGISYGASKINHQKIERSAGENG